MLKGKFLVNIFSKIIIQGLSFLASIIIGRFAGAGILGNISLATSFQNIFNTTLSVSLGNAHLKLFNENPSIGYKTFITLSIVLRTAIAVIIAGICGYLIFTESELYTELQIYLIALFIIQTFFGVLVQANNYIFTGRLEQVKANSPFILQSVLVSSAKILAVLIGYSEFGIAGFMIVAAIVSVILPIVQFAKLELGRFLRDAARKYVSVASKLLSAAISHSLLLSYDKIVLGAVIVNEEILGYYSAGDRIGTLLLGIGTSLGGIFLSQFTKDKKVTNSVQIILKHHTFVFVVLIPCTYLISLFSKEIITVLFGQEFETGYIVMIILMAHAVIKILNVPFQNIFISQDYLRQFNRINIIYSISIVSITTYFAIINPFENYLLSVSLAVFLSAIVERILMFSFLIHEGEKIFFSNKLRKLIILSISACYFFSCIYFINFSITSKLLVFPIATIVYTLIVYSLRVFDYKFILGFFRGLSLKKIMQS